MSKQAIDRMAVIIEDLPPEEQELLRRWDFRRSLVPALILWLPVVLSKVTRTFVHGPLLIVLLVAAGAAVVFSMRGYYVLVSTFSLTVKRSTRLYWEIGLAAVTYLIPIVLAATQISRDNVAVLTFEHFDIMGSVACVVIAVVSYALCGYVGRQSIPVPIRAYIVAVYVFAWFVFVTGNYGEVSATAAHFDSWLPNADKRVADYLVFTAAAYVGITVAIVDRARRSAAGNPASHEPNR